MNGDKKYENLNIRLNMDESFSSELTVEESIARIEKAVEELVKDMELPDEEEVQRRIQMILEKAESNDKARLEAVAKKNAKRRKNTIKAVLLVAMISVLAVTTIIFAGTENDIKIENGFVAYVKDNIVITFFDEDEYIYIESLMYDLAQNGYEDVVLPAFFGASCKVSLPKYTLNELSNMVHFDISFDDTIYSFCIMPANDLGNEEIRFPSLEEVKVIEKDGATIYVFDYGYGNTGITYTYGTFEYDIISKASFEQMIEIANSVL